MASSLAKRQLRHDLTPPRTLVTHLSERYLTTAEKCRKLGDALIYARVAEWQTR